MSESRYSCITVYLNKSYLLGRWTNKRQKLYLIKQKQPLIPTRRKGSVVPCALNNTHNWSVFRLDCGVILLLVWAIMTTVWSSLMLIFCVIAYVQQLKNRAWQWVQEQQVATARPRGWSQASSRGPGLLFLLDTCIRPFISSTIWSVLCYYHLRSIGEINESQMGYATCSRTQWQ